MSPAKKRRAIQRAQQALQVSERRACRAAEQPRSKERLQPRIKSDEEPLREAVIALALEYGRYGYRQITGLLRLDGWRVNHKRIERIWRQEGLKVPEKQPKRRSRKAGWMNDGSCIRLRPEREEPCVDL